LATKSSTVKKRSRSVLKRIRQSEKRKLRNQAWLTQIKTYLKKFEKTLSSNDKDAMNAVLKDTIIVINKAATKGVIHKNKASRKISRLMKKFNSTFSASASTN
jgi:small subunit ribosomal protein S20